MFSFIRVKTVLLSALLFLSLASGLTFGQEPNAGPLYIQASQLLGDLDGSAPLGFLSFEDVTKLPDLEEKTKSLFRRPEIGKVMGILVQASAMPACTFPPAISPLCGRLAALARVGAAIKEEKQPENALTLLLAAYQIGHHMGIAGTIIGTIGGIAHQTKALRMLSAFFQRHPDSALKKKARDFFLALPQPLIDVPEAIRRHRSGLADLLEGAKSSPANLATAGLHLDPSPEAIARFEKEIAPVKQCQATQRELLNAVKMLTFDLQDAQAKPPTDIVGALIEKKYLASAPACPVGGNYSFTFHEKADPTVKCSVHPDLNTALPLASPKDLEDSYRRFVAAPTYAKNVAELLSMVDESSTLDPTSADFASRTAALQQRFEVGSNPLILAFAPDAGRLYRLAKTLQEAFDKLMKQL